MTSAATAHHLAVQPGWVPDDTFGARLALVRQHMGWNITQAALACGQNEETWRGWEKFGRSPRRLQEVARRIADASGCSYSWLMLGGDRDSGCIPGWLDALDGGVAQLTLFGGAEPTMAAVSRLDALLYSTADRDRRYHEVPVDIDRRHALGVAA